jgi:hypothetical protein
MAGLDPSPPGRPKAKYNGSAPASEDRACRRAGALRSWTEFGASALLARGRLLDRFGFSWTIAVLPRTARKQGLDFLGFSRSNRDFSMGYAGFVAEENFSRSFAAGVAAPGQEAGILTMQKRSLAHRASLIQFRFSAINCRRQKSSILC